MMLTAALIAYLAVGLWCCVTSAYAYDGPRPPRPAYLILLLLWPAISPIVGTMHAWRKFRSR